MLHKDIALFARSCTAAIKRPELCHPFNKDEQTVVRNLQNLLVNLGAGIRGNMIRLKAERVLIDTEDGKIRFQGNTPVDHLESMELSRLLTYFGVRMGIICVGIENDLVRPFCEGLATGIVTLPTLACKGSLQLKQIVCRIAPK